METGRLLNMGANNPYMNMAIDEAISISIRGGNSPLTLRFYAWNTPSISLGYFQDIRKEIDIDRCNLADVKIVRRITGGKGVYHKHDLTYSIAGRTDSIIFTKDLFKTQDLISRSLLEGLKSIGIETESSPIPLSKRNIRSRDNSGVCFQTISRKEILFAGKKIIGNAQRRWRDSFMQQGSIMIHFDPVETFSFFFFPSEMERSIAIQEAETKITCLNEILKSPIGIDNIKKGLISGFENIFEIRLIDSILSKREEEIANKLFTEKYSTPEWNIDKDWTIMDYVL